MYPLQQVHETLSLSYSFIKTPTQTLKTSETTISTCILIQDTDRDTYTHTEKIIHMLPRLVSLNVNMNTFY